MDTDFAYKKIEDCIPVNGLRNTKNGSDQLFAGKVGQCVLIAMKLERDVWRRLLDVHIYFKIDHSKHVEKSPENCIKNSKTRKNNRRKFR